MQPVQCDINLYRGDDFELVVRLRTSTWSGSTWVPGAYLDLTGWLGAAQIRANEDATTIIAAIEVEVLDQMASPGTVRLSMTGTVTSKITAAGVWDLQFSEPNGRVNTYLKGKVAIVKDVTRP